MRKYVTAMMSVCLLAAPVALHAQSRPIELGVDGGVVRNSAEGSTSTTLLLPGQTFRVGFFVSDRVSIEPEVQFLSNKSDDRPRFTNYGAGVGLLLHLTGKREGIQPFLRPTVGYGGTKAGDDSNGSAVAGVAVGLKAHNGDRLALRVSADYRRIFEDKPIPAQNSVGLTVGLSFFTK